MKNGFLLDLIIDMGFSKDQAKGTLIVVSDYAKEKLPVLRGNINTFLNEELENADKESSPCQSNN